MYKTWIAFWTMVSYSVIRYFRGMWQYIIPPLVTNILYFAIFGKIVGSRVGLIDGVTYIDFIAPGLIMMTIITSTFSGTLTSVFFSKFCRNIEEIVIAPISTPMMLLGFISAGMLRGLINGVLVMIAASFFVPLSFHHLGLTILTIVLTTLVFSLIGFTNALFARKWDDVAIVPTFFLAPVTYLGGVFFSIHSLAAGWQHIALFNPVLYIINAFRYSLIGVTDVPVSRALIVMVILVIALFIMNVHLLSKGIGIRT